MQQAADQSRHALARAVLRAARLRCRCSRSGYGDAGCCDNARGRGETGPTLVVVAAAAVTDWSGFARLLNTFQDGAWIYRGQSQDWPLKTTLERRLDDWGIKLSSGPGVERQLIRKFRRRFQGTELDDVINDKLFCLALMQHHGAPTRLLDCTYSPFVAAQLAVKGGQTIKNGERAAHVIWCFRAEWLKNQAGSKVGRGKVQARNKARNDCSFDKLYQNKEDEKFVLHDNPWRLNERLSIQQGIFLCPATVGSSFLSNLMLMDAWYSRDNICKIVLDLELGKLIQFGRMLKRMNISSAALFPGLDGFSRSLGEHIFHYYELASTGAGKT